MTENKRFIIKDSTDGYCIFDSEKEYAFVPNEKNKIALMSTCKTLNELAEENEQLKQRMERYDKFMNSGEHVRLSINCETGELQRHIYATGQWFGDFDRVLCKHWINIKDYQKFIDRIIEVYNSEFKKDWFE